MCGNGAGRAGEWQRSRVGCTVRGLDWTWPWTWALVDGHPKAWQRMLGGFSGRGKSAGPMTRPSDGGVTSLRVGLVAVTGWWARWAQGLVGWGRMEHGKSHKEFSLEMGIGG